MEVPLISLFYERGWMWCANELGIVMEIIGAAIIVIAAIRTRSKIKDIPNNMDSDLPAELRDVISGQAVTELWGFGLLALGLIGQFVGGFK